MEGADCSDSKHHVEVHALSARARFAWARAPSRARVLARAPLRFGCKRPGEAAASTCPGARARPCQLPSRPPYLPCSPPAFHFLCARAPRSLGGLGDSHWSKLRENVIGAAGTMDAMGWNARSFITHALGAARAPDLASKGKSMTPRRLACLLALFAVTLTSITASMATSMAAPARADQPTAVMVPPYVEAGIAEGLVTRAVEQLRRELENGDDSYSVISHGQAVEIAEADQADRFTKPKGEPDVVKCVSADCAVWFRRVLNSDVAIQLSLFNKVDEKKRLAADRLSVTLVRDAEAHWQGSASIEAGAIEKAIQAAFLEAQAKKRKGVGPWVAVHGTPEGAGVYLDGNLIGRVPMERQRIEDASSLHVLSVKHRGYHDDNRTLELRGDISREEVIEVQLDKLGEKPKASASAGPSVFRRWVGPSLLVAAGAGLLAAGLVPLKDRGCVEESPLGGCLREGQVQTGALLAWTVPGALLVASGVTWFIVGRRAQTQLNVHARGLTLSGSF